MRLSSPASVAQSAAASSVRGKTGYRSWRDRFFYLLFFASVVIGIAGLVTLLLNVLVDAWGVARLAVHHQLRIAQAGARRDICSSAGNCMGNRDGPPLSRSHLGVGTAVYLEEFSGESRFSRLVQLNIANLAGVPSIVLRNTRTRHFSSCYWDMGRSVLAGGLTLTLLVLPIVIIATQESIRAVPPSYRDAAFAMGATRWQVVKGIVLPPGHTRNHERCNSGPVTGDR